MATRKADRDLPDGVREIRVISMTDGKGQPVTDEAKAVNIELVKVMDDGSQQRVYIGPHPA